MPTIESEPARGVHRTGFRPVTLVQSTILVSPLKHESVTVASPC
jgi:hypothetical protein